MRIHLAVIDLDGRRLHEDTIESMVITLGEDDRAMFHHDALPWMEVRHDGARATLVIGRNEHPLRRSNVIPLPDQLHTLQIDLYLRQDAMPRVSGRCPTCGEALVDHQIGGAYRSVAKRERRCGRCDTAVVGLRDAPDVVGRFHARSAGDWFHVTVSSRCPDCMDSMERAVFRADRGEVEVERCRRCALVVLDATDQARLSG